MRLRTYPDALVMLNVEQLAFEAKACGMGIRDADHQEKVVALRLVLCRTPRRYAPFWPYPRKDNPTVARVGDLAAFFDERPERDVDFKELSSIDLHSSKYANCGGLTDVVEMVSPRTSAAMTVVCEIALECGSLQNNPRSLFSEYKRVGFLRRDGSSGSSSGSLAGGLQRVTNVVNANAGHNERKRPDDAGGPQHTLGPIRHLPLGVQILLGALGFAASLFGVFVAFDRFCRGRLGDAFLVILLGGIASGALSLVTLIGGLVAL